MTTPLTIAALPGYYHLYALYAADYPLNNRFYNDAAYRERLARALREVTPLILARRVDRQTWALRLFIRRESLSADLLGVAQRQLRRLLWELGPPLGWREKPIDASTVEPLSFPPPPIRYDFDV